MKSDLEKISKMVEEIANTSEAHREKLQKILDDQIEISDRIKKLSRIVDQNYIFRN